MKKLLSVTSLAAISLGLAATPASAEDTADKTTEETRERGEILVTGQHLQEEVLSGKDDIPLIDLPQAISVVSAEDLKLRGVTRISDALFSVAGTSRSSTYGFYDAYTLRGFDAAYGSLFLDGLINEAGGGGSNNELFGLESIEAVKGPAAALFGGGSLGGIINLVSKRPVLDRSFAEISLSTGSFDLIEGTVDANVPLNADNTLAARVVALHRDAGSFVKFAGYNRIYLQPSLTWQIGPQTRFTAIATYKRDDDNPWGPLPAYGTVFPLADGSYLPRDFAVSNGGDQKPVQTEKRKTAGWMLDHDFSDSLSLSQNARYMHRSTFWEDWLFVGDYLSPDPDPDSETGWVVSPLPTDTLGRIFYGPYQETFKSFLVDSRLSWKADVAGMRHNLLGGVDYRRTRSSYTGNGDYDPTKFPINIYNPDYNVPLNPLIAPYGGSDRGSQLGFYIQDHIELGDRVTVTLNGRWDKAKYNVDSETAFSPRVGATFRVAQGVSLYGSWSKSFTPQFFSQIVTGIDGDGNPIPGTAPAERGKNIEAGVKFDLAPSKLSGMVSIYQLTRSNVTTADPDFPMYSRVSGKQRSEGAELELHWRPAPGVALDLAYAYIKARYLEDSTYPVGAPLPNIPKHNVSLFGSYVVPEGAFAGLGANLGIAHSSNRYTVDAWAYGGQDPVILLKAYTLVNAGLSYAFSGWQAQVNVNNIFNKRFFTDACCLTRVTPGDPRTWRLTLRRSF